MNDKLDPLIDQAIEAEKQQALRRFHLSPLRPSPGPTGKVSGWPFPLRLTRAWIWGGCAAMVLLAFGVVLMLEYKGRSSASGVDSRTIEQAFLAIQRNQHGPALPVFSSTSSDRTYSDMSWNIQSAICRLRRSQYSNQELGKAVMRTLSRGMTPLQLVVRLDNEVVQGLDFKLRQISENNAVARVLLKQSQSQ